VGGVSNGIIEVDGYQGWWEGEEGSLLEMDFDRDLHGNILQDMEDYWGDKIRPKEENHLWIVFQNINHFLMYESDSKNKSIQACIKGIQADIVGLVELGL
jgi:hypothetical protein